jgi:hypothetical protein
MVLPRDASNLHFTARPIRKPFVTSATKNMENTQPATQPTPAALARWLLTNEIGEQPGLEAIAAAGERAYLRMRERLAVLLGTTGFDALWARAIHVAQREFCTTGNAAAEVFSTHMGQFQVVVRGHDAETVQHNLVVVFASFITLLFTFIGEELGLRFLRQIWPNLPPDTAESQAKGTTP